MRNLGRWLGLATIAMIGCDDLVAPDPAPDVTADIVVIAQPFASKPAYARNVWDMQLYNGRIYLGHGDSQDNHGPITIWSLQPGSGVLTAEFETSEEQVDIFRVLDGTLYVPGHDPRDDFTFGNFYRLEDGRWVKHRKIPHGLHAFDLAWYSGQLFAALGAQGIPGEETVMASTDRGATWTVATDELQRVYDLFQFRGELYGAPLLWNSRDSVNNQLLHFDGSIFTRTAMNGATLMPGAAAGVAGRMIRAVEFEGALVYIVARKTFDWMPVSLAVARSLSFPARVELPDPAAVPTDILLRGGALLVVAVAPADGGYTVRTYRTVDLKRWTELFYFHAATFPRSFEESQGDFFFGLGTSYAAPSPASGTILKVPRISY